MNDFLVNHAYTHVWCDPEQDFQHIIMPQRVTDPRGVMGSCQLLWRTITLPTPADKYHVYQIGQVNPEALGLLATQGAWTSLAKVQAQRLVYIQVYTTAGLVFPLAESYIMFTRDRTLVVAVKEQPGIAPLKTTDLYFRFYANAYYASRRSDPTVNAVRSGFYRHTNAVAALSFQNQVHLFKAKPGFTALYRNGAYVNDFLPSQLTVGEVLEFVYDSSVKKVVDFNLTDLKTFESIKDDKVKYLLHYAGGQAGDLTIDYRDDCDLFLFKRTPNLQGSAYKGCYFHKNQDEAFRQVTHRDYAVAVPYVAAYQTGRDDWSDLAQLTLRLVIRNAGYDRALVDESHRIKELYKLDEEHLVNAFLGIDSTVSVWRAPALENSDYVRVMDAEVSQLTLPLVESAYGYNAMATLLGDSPQVLTVNRPITLAPALTAGSTMYEYDAQGKLLGCYPHVLGQEYMPVYPNTRLVEGIVGTGSAIVPQVMGQQDTPYLSGLSYRFYIAPIDQGQVVASNWMDVTGDDSKYLIVNSKVHWLVDRNAFQVAVKSDQAFLAYDLSLSPSNGLLKFSVQGRVSYPTGMVTEVLTIPVGQLDLWLNGYALIENVDYYVTWPQIVIVNKAFLVEGNVQQITVRGTGFCQADLSRLTAEETSFVQYGVLSHNDRFNIRDDKVIRIVANGRTFHRSQLEFSEDLMQMSLPAVPNGSPYAISNVVVPLRGYVDQDTYALQAPALAIDQEIADYLTLHLPDTRPSTPDIIADKYSIYSPFSSTIMHDLINGALPMDNFMGRYSDKDVKDYLAPYVYLLAFDPIQRGVDTSHVAVHPHNLNVVAVLNIYQYNFLARAIHIFLDDKVDITRFISIKESWI